MGETATTYDLFLSYSHADADWVRTLAENLHNSGLEVFFDEWRIGPGDVLIHKLDEGILTSRSGVLVVSPESLSRPRVHASNRSDRRTRPTITRLGLEAGAYLSADEALKLLDLASCSTSDL